MEWLRQLGTQIRQAREGAGLTQQQLAENLSVSREQLSNYENGKSVPPVNVVTEIADVVHEEFTVRGYKITRSGTPKRSKPCLEPHQLCLGFDKEHKFSEATLKIKPSGKSVIITATVRHSRRA
jgi:transcriptional regulator with XRE-family HTH domain